MGPMGLMGPIVPQDFLQRSVSKQSSARFPDYEQRGSQNPQIIPENRVGTAVATNWV